ncbi:MAG: efflux RND transporter periplasmic adaptor subunit [Rickettsiales bacterium]
MKKKKIFLILVLVVAVIGAAMMAPSNGEENNQFRTAKITRGDIAQVVTANGTLNPTELVSVGTQVSGKINNIYVSLNDTVTKGQLLAEIDPSIPETTLRQSKANLETARNAYELARRNLQRTRALYKKQFVAKIDLENAEQSYLSSKNSYESQKTQVERDEVNLSYTKITSPIDGVIIAQEVSEGQTMAANFQTPNLFKIASDLTKMKIDVNFSEADISKVKAGQPVSFTVDAYEDKEFEGKVRVVNINPVNQSGVVTYSVTVDVENPEKLLLPGMTAFVRVILSEEKDVLRVPAASLRFSPPEEQASGLTTLFTMGTNRKRHNYSSLNNKKSVYLLKNGKLVEAEVEVGSTDETYVEVSGKDIAEGDTVVISLMPSNKR